MSVEKIKKNQIIQPKAKEMGLLVENPVINHLDILGVMMLG